jgi:hypothetical protein
VAIHFKVMIHFRSEDNRNVTSDETKLPQTNPSARHCDPLRGCIALGAPAGEDGHWRRLHGHLLRREFVLGGADTQLLELERQLVKSAALSAPSVARRSGARAGRS